jgi:hypothetical protein
MAPLGIVTTTFEANSGETRDKILKVVSLEDYHSSPSLECIRMDLEDA